MREQEAQEIVRGIENFLGLEPDRKPDWGNHLDRAIFPEEALTREQRKFAGWCLRNLSFFVAGYELAFQQGNIPPLTPQHIRAFYSADRQEMQSRWGEHFADFNLMHVLGSAKRHIAWLNDLKVYEETDIYDPMLQRLLPTHHLLKQAVHPPSPSGPVPPK